MTNKGIICIAIAIAIAIWLWSDWQRTRFTIKNTASPLPINLYTNGVADGNSNNVANRVNFQQQPVGINQTG